MNIVRALPVLGLLLSACSKPPLSEPAARTIPVVLASVSSEPLAQPVTATGTFASRDEIPLAFKIGGVVARVSADEGQVVKRGQLLAVLDLREIDAQLAKARVALDKAERDQARLGRLVADSVATHTQFDDATSARDAARADYNAAKVNREFATIVAPEDGVVLARAVTAGTTIGAGTTVLRLGGNARGRVLRAGLPDRDALRVRIGDKATATFDALPGRTFGGRVIQLSGSADARTGTYGVEIALSDTHALPAGLVGRLNIAVQSQLPVTLVPVDALLEADSDSATVYTVAGDREPKAEQHRVHIVQLAGDRVVVTGLDASARVITAGASYVTPGARVRVTNLPTVTATRTATPLARAINRADSKPTRRDANNGGAQP